MTVSPAAVSRVRWAPSWVRTRSVIALLLVLLYAGVSTLQWLRRAAAWPASSEQDEISAYERRFMTLRSALPHHGVVGYLGHPELTGSASKDADAAALLHFRRYLLAQYSLAPVLLVESTDRELMVGNFDPGTLPQAPPGFRLIRDFGGGVVLFQRAGS